VQTAVPTSSSLSRDYFDESLSGVGAEAPSPRVSCSATEWKECEYGFHLSLETTVIEVSRSLFLSPFFWTVLMMLGSCCRQRSCKEEEVQFL